MNKILIANRGEIACRIIKSARRMEIATVAVYSDADRNARHVQLADEAVSIGPAAPRQSYLAIDRIIDACRRTASDAVHPGYGFLSENEEFARRIEEAGIVFIGPKYRSIAAMGDKIASKKIAREAQVNTIPGNDAPIGTPEQAVAIARSIGYPVMIKASAGGGGKGLRVAFDDDDARGGFMSCRNEARNAFGDDRVFIEKFIVNPRHIEIQVLGDAHGEVVYLGERECSIQRRHQKVVEEAPSPFVDENMRKAMGEQAVALAKAVNYESAGTVEFIVGADKSFYFLEMNTRLQVEHPVTELVTGLDLVELMIRIAAGERLPFGQADIKRTGWAMECRINAEDPFRGFLPSIGRVVRFLPPLEKPGEVRIDAGIVEGSEISMHYDSMIAKLITHGATRIEAIGRMRDALDAFVIRGIASNIPFQAALMRHERFVTGDITTEFIAKEFPDGLRIGDLAPQDPTNLICAAASVHLAFLARNATISGQLAGHEYVPDTDLVVIANGAHHRLSASPAKGGYLLVLGDASYAMQAHCSMRDGILAGAINGKPLCVQFERHGVGYRLSQGGSRIDALVMSGRAAELQALMLLKTSPDRSNVLLSPMPGLLTEISVTAGQEIRAGDRLAVIEAMKMENVLNAEKDGVIAEVLVSPGESLAAGQAIVRFA